MKRIFARGAAAAAVMVLLAGCIALSGCGVGSSAEFDQKGIKINMETDKTYEYTTVCYDDATKTTVGTAEIISATRVSYDVGHEAKDGYEWQLVTMRITFNDQNAWDYGFKFAYRIENYYDISACDNNTYNETYGGSFFTITYNDQEYSCYMSDTAYLEGWTTDEAGNHSRVVNITFSAQVPEGYDGMVFGLMNAKLLDSTSGKTFDQYYKEDDFLLFRFK